MTAPRTLRVGSLNVRGCGRDEMKIGDRINVCEVDVLPMSETKMKGKGERESEFGSMLGRVSDMGVGGKGLLQRAKL